MKMFLVAFCFSVALSSNANATVSYWYQDGNWSVWSEKATCKATNRPVIEVSHSPYMSFWLIHDTVSSAVTADVYFWPGALTIGEKFNVNFLQSGGSQIMVPAEATLDFALRTERPFSDDELLLLAEQDLLIVQPENSKTALAVDAIKISNVLRQLESCADLLSRSIQE